MARQTAARSRTHAGAAAGRREHADAAPTRAAAPGVRREAPGGIGDSARRPDATPKVTGQFAYGSDLWMDDMIWGVTLRSPHPYAKISSIAIGEALATSGVYAVLTHEDVPGANACGLELADQPVLASGVVRYQGEPVALVAADHPEIARQAAKKIAVEYEVLSPVTDAVAALAGTAPKLHPQGNLVRHLKLRKGDPAPSADVVVTGSLPGRHAGPGVPRPGGGPGRAGRGGRGRPVRGHAVAARRPEADLRGARPVAGAGQAGAGRGRRGVRRPRGSVHARARVHAGPAHRQAGQDGLQPRGVVLRARAPAPGHHALRARRQPGRHARLHQG